MPLLLLTALFPAALFWYSGAIDALFTPTTSPAAFAQGANGPTARQQTIELLDVPSLAQTVMLSRSGVVTAFVLSPNGTLGRALTARCRTGSQFSIILDGRNFVRASNERSLRAFAAAGCKARLADGPIHMKLVYLDKAMFLSDTNFAHGYVVRDDDPGDRSLAASALQGHGGANDRFSTIKPKSLDLEARIIAAARGSLDVETESFSANNPTTDALFAKAGKVPIRLLVAAMELSRKPSEARTLGQLAAAGVQVRVTRETDKMAIADDLAWLGSTNASAGVNDQIDWGLAILDGRIANALRARFNENWNRAEAP